MLLGAITSIGCSLNLLIAVELDLNCTLSVPSANSCILDEQKVPLSHREVLLVCGDCNSVSSILSHPSREDWVACANRCFFESIEGILFSVQNLLIPLVSSLDQLVKEWAIRVVPNLLDASVDGIAELGQKTWSFLALLFASLSSLLTAALSCLLSLVLEVQFCSDQVDVISNRILPENRLTYDRELKLVREESLELSHGVVLVKVDYSQHVSVCWIADVVRAVLSAVRRLATRPPLEGQVEVL